MTRSSTASFQFQLLGQEPRTAASVSTQSTKPTLVADPPPVEPAATGAHDALRRVREELRASVLTQLSSGSELLRSLARRRREEILPTTLPELDALIGGGLPRGKLVELASRRSAGRFSVVLSTLAAATSMGEAAALIDLGDHFDPQVAAADGIELTRLLWVRPHTLKEAVGAAELLMPTGFQLLVLDAGLHPIRGRRVPDAAWIRLARAAEAAGTALLLSTPYPLAGSASEIALSSRTARVQWLGNSGAPRILGSLATHVVVEKQRHLRPGRSSRLSFALDEQVPESASSPSTVSTERSTSTATARAAPESPPIARAI